MLECFHDFHNNIVGDALASEHYTTRSEYGLSELCCPQVFPDDEQRRRFERHRSHSHGDVFVVHKTIGVAIDCGKRVGLFLIVEFEDEQVALVVDPRGLPFRFDVPTIRGGLNFTLSTAAGDLDLLGEAVGGGPLVPPAGTVGVVGGCGGFRIRLSYMLPISWKDRGVLLKPHDSRGTTHL